MVDAELPGASERIAIRNKAADRVYAGAVACELAYIDNGVGNLSRAYLELRSEMLALREQLRAAALVASNAARDKANSDRYVDVLREERDVLILERDEQEIALVKATEDVSRLDAENEALRRERDTVRTRYRDALADLDHARRRA